MSPELQRGFLAFWTEYPKRRAKIAAERAWVKLNPPVEMVSTILKGVRRYRESGEWSNPQFIPYPATFLNGRRWEDEVGHGTHEQQPDSEKCLFKKGYIPSQLRIGR